MQSDKGKIIVDRHNFSFRRLQDLCDLDTSFDLPVVQHTMSLVEKYQSTTGLQDRQRLIRCINFLHESISESLRSVSQSNSGGASDRHKKRQRLRNDLDGFVVADAAVEYESGYESEDDDRLAFRRVH